MVIYMNYVQNQIKELLKKYAKLNPPAEDTSEITRFKELSKTKSLEKKKIKFPSKTKAFAGILLEVAIPPLGWLNNPDYKD